MNTDIIQDDQNGFIAGTEDEWVDKLSRLLRSRELRQRLGQAGRATVEQKYSAITQTPRVYEIFKSVLRDANVRVSDTKRTESTDRAGGICFWEKLTYLVTGGAGFIGSHLVDALVDRGHRVRVLDALVSQVHGENAAPAYLNSAAEFIQADICDRDVVAAALEGIDVVFHEAAEVGVGQSMYEIERYVRANDLGTAVLLEAILERKSQIKKLVVASSMSIYGEGAYTCETCGPVAPQLRPSSQLLERRWEVECPTCGKQLSPALTTEEKPLFPTSVYAVTKQDQEQFCLAVGRSYGIPSVALALFQRLRNEASAFESLHGRLCDLFGASAQWQSAVDL